MSNPDAVARLVEKLRREYADVQLLPGVNYGDVDVLKACNVIEAGAALAAAVRNDRDVVQKLIEWDRAVAALGEDNG